MATKPQAKTMIDNAATSVKNDIDNVLPVGINIVDADINFGPLKYTIRLLAPDTSTANSWANSIVANLTGLNRNSTILTARRTEDGTRHIRITENRLNVLIFIN